MMAYELNFTQISNDDSREKYDSIGRYILDYECAVPIYRIKINALKHV